MTAASTTSFDDAQTILRHLITAGYESMFAGGCVRDRLLGVNPKDYDIATAATPQDTINLFSSLGLKVIPSGIDHGTVSVISRTGPIEITTLRRDIKTDGRHAIVDFKHATFETDALRRDFTINAMYEDIAGKILDFCGGLSDLKSRKLRFVGSPSQRIQEDYLRILRFFRFWARLEFDADPTALVAIKQESSGLRNISQERITAELWGILSAPGAGPVIFSMFEANVFSIVMPEARPLTDRHKSMVMDAAALDIKLRPWSLLGLLLGVADREPWQKDRLIQLGKRLRFSDKQSKIMTDLIVGWQALLALPRSTADALLLAENIEHQDDNHKVSNFFLPLWSFFSKHTPERSCLDAVNWFASVESNFGHRRQLDLPLTGHDILKAHPSLSGIEVGAIQKQLKRAFYNGEWVTTKEGLDLLQRLAEKKNSNQ